MAFDCGTIMYRKITHPYDDTVIAVLRLFDNTSIPFDPSNTDYQEYLKWLDEGNEPQPADEPTPPEQGGV
jgi:hypothetical protein